MQQFEHLFSTERKKERDALAGQINTPEPCFDLTIERPATCDKTEWTPQTQLRPGKSDPLQAAVPRCCCSTPPGSCAHCTSDFAGFVRFPHSH